MTKKIGKKIDVKNRPQVFGFKHFCIPPTCKQKSSKKLFQGDTKPVTPVDVFLIYVFFSDLGNRDFFSPFHGYFKVTVIFSYVSVNIREASRILSVRLHGYFQGTFPLKLVHLQDFRYFQVYGQYAHISRELQQLQCQMQQIHTFSSPQVIFLKIEKNTIFQSIFYSKKVSVRAEKYP